jgi:hypothetical protein
MPLLTVEQALDLTSPYHRLWITAHESAAGWYWGAFRTKWPDQFTAMTSTARAMMLHDMVVAAVQRDSMVLMADVFGFPVQLLSNGDACALVRFKMLDRGMRPRNHHSGQQDLLADHQFGEDVMQQLTLLGITEPPTVLNVGYQLSNAQDGISRLLAVSRHRNALRFWYDLDASAASGGGIVVDLPLGTPPESPRIISKRRKEEDAQGPAGPESVDE